MKYKVIPKSGMAILKKNSRIHAIIGENVLFKQANEYIDSHYMFEFLEISKPRDKHLETDVLGNRIFLDKDDSGEYKISGDIVNKIKVIRFNEGMLRKVCKFLKFLKN